MTHLEITALVGSIMLILALGTSVALFVKLLDLREDYKSLQTDKDITFERLNKRQAEVEAARTEKAYLIDCRKQAEEAVEAYQKELSDTKDDLKVKSRKIQLLQEENDYLLENGPNILKLPLKKAVFDEVLTGERNIIDLSVKESSKKRYFDDENGLKPYHAVEVFNGYTNRSESVLFKIIGISRLVGEDIEFEKLRFDIGDRLN